MRNKIHHFRRRSPKPVDWSEWIPLLEYSKLKFISASAARMRIVRGEIAAVKLKGRWYVLDNGG